MDPTVYFQDIQSLSKLLHKTIVGSPSVCLFIESFVVIFLLLSSSPMSVRNSLGAAVNGSFWVAGGVAAFSLSTWTSGSTAVGFQDCHVSFVV